jgi:uncharacterized phage protein (TIGR02218 family)
VKPCSAPLKTLLATRQFYAVDLYKFILVGGGTLRYCSGDADISYNGELYTAGAQTGPYFDRQDNKAKLHQKIGTAVDTLVFDVIPGSATVLGEPFLQGIHSGAFDGATLILHRVFMPTYGDTSRGALRMFLGRVADIDAGRSIATFTINSNMELNNLDFPRNLWQPGCVNNLGDASCGVTLASYSTTGVAAASGSTNAVINATLSGATGYYDLGKIVFTSGALSGVSRSIKTCAFGSPTIITLLTPFPEAPATGDQFTITAGCNKNFTDSNGCPKFSNTARYRGFDFVPQPVVAV